MRWEKRTPKPKKKRCVGEERTQYCFAVLPVLIGGMWVWLERFKSIDVWLEDDPNRIVSRCSWHHARRETINYV